MRAARVFFEDQRRSGELHLGSGRTTGATRADGKPAVRNAGRRVSKKNRACGPRGSGNGVAVPLARALTEGSNARRKRDTRGSKHASCALGSVKLQRLFLLHFFLALNTRGSERTGSPGRNRPRCEARRRSRRLGLTRNQRPFTRRGGGSLGSRVRPEDCRKTICGPTPADAIALCRGAREATRRQRYAHRCDRRRQRSEGPMGSPK